MILALLIAAHAAVPQTKCEACHTTAGWERVTFDHARTGFPLEGRHAQASCRGCHAGLDFKAPVARRCTECHRDVHAGEFGQRCDGCHDARGWEPRFDANAHRNSGFPLLGRHALVSCQECHPGMRDRSFNRATVQCVGCHQQDYARTTGTPVDHARAGFPTSCADCHGAYRFRGGRFAAHEACFEIRSGPHARFSCTQCHTTFPAIVASGACATNTASCTSCHEHSCARTDGQHSGVAGYQCKDRKCYECHRFSGGGGR